MTVAAANELLQLFDLILLLFDSVDQDGGDAVVLNAFDFAFVCESRAAVQSRQCSAPKPRSTCRPVSIEGDRPQALSTDRPEMNG
jgi:hypothetical protein